MPSEEAPRGSAIRVVICDNSWIVTQLLAEALRRESDLDVIGGGMDLRNLLSQTSSQQIDVALVSARSDDDPVRGLEIVRELKAARPQIRCIVLLENSKRDTILEAFRAGARGLFSRGDSVAILSKCIRAVHQGQIWANPEQLSEVVEAMAAGPRVKAVDANGFKLLSKREMDVVRSLAEGLPNRDIAKKLGLSQHTVKNYLFRIFDKLGVSSRLELLFMTLSQANSWPPEGSELDAELSPTANGNGLSFYQRAAEQGVLNAQVALAEMYSTVSGAPRDQAAAYMWYSVCEQTSMKLQVQAAVAKQKLAVSLSQQHQVEAEAKAARYLSTSSAIANGENGSSEPAKAGRASRPHGPTVYAGSD
jgi:DNA-binding NarL/FixJ family response regulator